MDNYTYTLIRTNLSASYPNKDLLETHDFKEILKVFNIMQNALISTDFNIQVNCVERPVHHTKNPVTVMRNMHTLMKHASKLNIEKQINELQEQLEALV